MNGEWCDLATAPLENSESVGLQNTNQYQQNTDVLENNKDAFKFQSGMAPPVMRVGDKIYVDHNGMAPGYVYRVRYHKGYRLFVKDNRGYVSVYHTKH